MSCRNCPKVHLSVTFAPTKSGSNPNIMIQNPIDLTELVGMFYPEEFVRLKQSLSDCVEDEAYDLFFHKDNKNNYYFDDGTFQHGAIYVRKEKKEEGDNNKTKDTASRLVAIQNAVEFEKHVEEVVDVVYRPARSKLNKMPKVDHYNVQLCVVIVKEKIQKPSKGLSSSRQSTACPPVSSITASESDISNIGEERASKSTPQLSTETSSRKRKERQPFTFKARNLSICLHAPIETMQKKNVTVTCVPKGKTNKDIHYSLSNYIAKRTSNVSVFDSDDESNENSFSNVFVNDEYFLSRFSLSRFRGELMKIAVEQFPEEYGPNKKALGAQVKLFIQKQWNVSSWTEVNTTYNLISNLMEMMEMSSRVRNGVLKVRFAFGKAKANKHFEDLESIDEYTDGIDGDGLEFSQTEQPASPFIRKSTEIMRHDSQITDTQVSQLIARIYKAEERKLYFGFFKQHVETFHRIITSNFAVHREESIFRNVIKSNIISTNDKLDTHLLSVYFSNNKNDVPGLLPELNKYPPTNPDMLVAPPDVKEWKKKNETCELINPFNLRPHQIPPSASYGGFGVTGGFNMPGNGHVTNRPTIVGLTFKVFGDDDGNV